MRELYKRVCGCHSGARAMRIRILKAKYYGPTTTIDCTKYVMKCIPCQNHGNTSHKDIKSYATILSHAIRKVVDGYYRTFHTKTLESHTPLLHYESTISKRTTQRRIKDKQAHYETLKQGNPTNLKPNKQCPSKYYI